MGKLLAHFYRLHFDELNRFVARRAPSVDAAADMTQEMFTRLMERGEQISDIRHPRGYLYRSAKNLVVESWRSSGEQVGDVLSEDLSLDGSASPETILQHRETLALLLEAIEALPPRCKEVFVLHRFDELSYSEIAERLDISVSAVEKQIMRAMKACRLALEPKKGRA